MQVFNRMEDASAEGKTAVALGFFDGMHLGHTAVIGLACAQRARGLIPTVFTFCMDNARPECGRRREGLLLTREDKLTLLERQGVKLALCPDFVSVMRMDAKAFVSEVLISRLHAGFVCCGEDFRFGHGAAAGVAQLREWCGAHDIEVRTLGQITHEGRRISSTWARELLAAGEAEQAASLLGRPFGYTLPVVAGKRLGRTIGSPTINQPLPEELVRLRHGVYACVVQTPDGVWRTGVANIGLRPTVERSETVNSETYIHDFSGDLYGQRVRTLLLRFLRPEQKFSSVEELRSQIAADAQHARPIAEEFLKKLPQAGAALE